MSARPAELTAALEFLLSPSVQQAPLSQRVAYLESQNFSEKEIAVALRMADGASRQSGAMSVASMSGVYGAEQGLGNCGGVYAYVGDGIQHAGAYDGAVHCAEEVPYMGISRCNGASFKGSRGGGTHSTQWRGQRVATGTKLHNSGAPYADSAMLASAGRSMSSSGGGYGLKQRWRPPSAPGSGYCLQTQDAGSALLYNTPQAPQNRGDYATGSAGITVPMPWGAPAVPGPSYAYSGGSYPLGGVAMDPEPKPPNVSSGAYVTAANLVEACSIDDRNPIGPTVNVMDHESDGMKVAFPRHARRREAKRQRKAAAAAQQGEGAENKTDEDDALPWFKTIASGRVQKHLMRFLNNFIVSKDLEDELGLHVADVFYHNSESESGPTMAALYEKLEQRVAERCPDRIAEFRKEALESLTALMAACEEREEQQERGREALKNAGHRGKPVRNAAKRLGKSRTEARKLAAMVAHYRSLSLDGDDEGSNLTGGELLESTASHDSYAEAEAEGSESTDDASARP